MAELRFVANGKRSLPNGDFAIIWVKFVSHRHERPQELYGTVSPLSPGRADEIEWGRQERGPEPDCGVKNLFELRFIGI